MDKIRPFKAVTYNQEKIKNLSDVVCPPYDVIPPMQQKYYLEKSPYNFIHILLGKDSPNENKYQRAANYFKEWVKEKVLIQADDPAIYFYTQEYLIRGEKRIRFGLIGLMRLDEKGSSVLRHEHTRLEPKEDRLKLLKQVKANLSPIFVIIEDKKRVIQRLYKNHIVDTAPLINLTDQEKVVHKLWKISDPKLLRQIESDMSNEYFFIADGHHRYEVACAYREEMKKRLGQNFTGEEKINYILTYFTNTDAHGLAILPVHRLVKLAQGFDFNEFAARLSQYFEMNEVKEKVNFFFLMEKCGRTEQVIGMYFEKKFWLLRLKNIKILDKMIPDKPKEYRLLDVSVLNSIILDKVLCLGEKDKERVTFTPFAEEFIKEADNDPSNVVFFLNAVKVNQITAVALKGERMPPKSTYFFPKVLSGLLINKLEG